MKIIKSIFFFFVGYIISAIIPLNFSFIECMIFGFITAILYNLFRENSIIKFLTDIMVILLSSYLIIKMLPIPKFCNENILVLSFMYLILVFLGIKVFKISLPKYKFASKNNNSSKDSSTPRLYNHSNLYFIIIESRIANGLIPGMGGSTWFENYYIYSPTVDVFIHVNGTLEIKANAEIIQAPTITFFSAYDNSKTDEVIYTGDHDSYKNKLFELAAKYQFKNFYVTNAAKFVNEYKSHFIKHQQSYEQKTNSSNNSEEVVKNTADTSLLPTLFAGCKDTVSLKKRYLQLLKVYHPDNTNGDAEMTLKIQNTYNMLKSQL